MMPLPEMAAHFRAAKVVLMGCFPDIDVAGLFLAPRG